MRQVHGRHATRRPGTYSKTKIEVQCCRQWYPLWMHQLQEENKSHSLDSSMPPSDMRNSPVSGSLSLPLPRLDCDLLCSAGTLAVPKQRALRILGGVPTPTSYPAGRRPLRGGGTEAPSTEVLIGSAGSGRLCGNACWRQWRSVVWQCPGLTGPVLQSVSDSQQSGPTDRKRSAPITIARLPRRRWED